MDASYDSKSPASTSSTTAIWLVCIGIGLLFLVRGAFINYAKPLFEHLGGFSFAQIAALVNCYVFAQSVFAPVAGWYTDRMSPRIALATSIALGIASFWIIAAKPFFAMALLAVFAAGVAFVLGKIALNTILVVQSSADILRRSVAKRATLLNLGSFTGNTIAYQVTKNIGYRPHAVLLGLLHLPLLIGLAAPAAVVAGKHEKTWGMDNLRLFARNRAFIADALRRFAMVLPYGCWGTVIPMYVIDTYGSNKPVWIVGMTSLCTTLVGAHFLAVHLSAKLYRLGFKWEWWSMTSVFLYCAGLLLLIFAGHPIMLPIAIIVFICGEVLMTPCFDETAKKHSHHTAMGTCMGLLHLVDGSGRLFGSAFALAVYGWMRSTTHRSLYWPIVVAVFFIVSSALHVVAHNLAGGGDRISSEPMAVGAAIPVAE